MNTNPLKEANKRAHEEVRKLVDLPTAKIVKSNLYYEAHVTIEPVFSNRLSELKTIAKDFGFRVAELVMKKTADETGTAARDDTFCSSRSNNYDDIITRTFEFCDVIQKNDFKVFRYKIEDTLLDSKICDKWNIIEGQ